MTSGLSLTMPTARFSDQALHETFLPALNRTATSIQQALGG